jgi:nucleoid-associated protein YgaU
MSLRRLAVTTLAMASIAVVLAALSPGTAVLEAAVTRPQDLADTAAPESVVLAWTALLAWSAWTWGALGLVLTALSAIPGIVGACARLSLRAVLPAGARRGAALALGIGLGVGLGAPALASPAPQPVPAGAPDWPAAPRSAGWSPTAVPGTAGPAVDRGAPDWPAADAPVPAAPAPAAPAPAAPAPTAPAPTAPAAGTPTAAAPAPGPAGHVVVPGDCLWEIAAADLRNGSRPAGDAEVAAAVSAWWQANAGTIGPDPDLLLPGQVLHPPAAP